MVETLSLLYRIDEHRGTLEIFRTEWLSMQSRRDDCYTADRTRQVYVMEVVRVLMERRQYACLFGCLISH
jgi:hypothetical protein